MSEKDISGVYMLLTITNTSFPATDMGYLLHKNPSNVQSFEISFGKVYVYYTEATAERCTVALLLDIDPISMVRGRSGQHNEGRVLSHYVNDRPYVASSFLSVAIAKVFGSAFAGRSREKPELIEIPLSLQATLSVLPCYGGESLLRRLFEPLGYEISADSYPLDELYPEWGASPYYNVELSAEIPLRDLLTHLYVLVPVLDNDKHYWVSDDEVEKLIRHGDVWLKTHPERELIALRYLKHRRSLAREALEQLNEGEGINEPNVYAKQEYVTVEDASLNEQRISAVLAVLKHSKAKRVIDLGCGEGRLLKHLLDDLEFEEIVGLDVSYRAIERIKECLHIDRMPLKKRKRLNLIHGSLMYRDKRIAGYDAATVVEVIEHLDSSRLAAFERVLFEFAKPAMVIITTPNAEYNSKLSNLTGGGLRHKDHRFEWTRAEFESWANRISTRFNYQVNFLPIGNVDERMGSPTQMGLFRLK